MSIRDGDGVKEVARQGNLSAKAKLNSIRKALQVDRTMGWTSAINGM